MKKYVIFYIQLKQNINMICGMNQKLFLFLIQKFLSTKNAKLNATKMKKYGIFYINPKQKINMIRGTILILIEVLYCQTKLVKISFDKKNLQNKSLDLRRFFVRCQFSARRHHWCYRLGFDYGSILQPSPPSNREKLSDFVFLTRTFNFELVCNF